jgi:hypothetical protein
MRRIRNWLVAFLALAVLVSVGVVFYFKFVDTSYSRAEFYDNTGIVPAPIDTGAIGTSALIEQDGQITLHLSRGEPHATFSTYHGWNETIWIVIRRPASGERIQFASPEVKTAFSAFDSRHLADIGDGGVSGSLQVVSVNENRIVASYDVTVDACYRSPYQPCLRHKNVVFRGQSTFRLRPRPESAVLGDLWPRSSQTNAEKK